MRRVYHVQQRGAWFVVEKRKSTRFPRATKAGPCAKREMRRVSWGNTRVGNYGLVRARNSKGRACWLENFGAGLSQALPPLFFKFQLRFFKEFLAVGGVARHGCSFGSVALWFCLQVRSEIGHQLAKNGARSCVRTSIVGMSVIATSDVIAYHQ